MRVISGSVAGMVSVIAVLAGVGIYLVVDSLPTLPLGSAGAGAGSAAG